jgi:hypothetical protein
MRPVSVSVSKSVLDTHFETAIVPLVERIKSVVSEKDVKKVTADRKKCWNCPHRSYCPTDKENPLMSIFDKFAKKTGAAASITPSDAPKSDPAQAAKPVEGFTAVPPPKTEGEKKRRMLIVDSPATAPVEEGDDEEKAAMAALAAIKAKKAAAVLAAAAAAKAAEEKAAAEAAAAEEVQDDQIVQDDSKEEKKSKGGRPPGAKNKPKTDGEETTEVAYGLTVNLGVSVGAVRFDVRRSKRHTAEQADAVYEELFNEVKGLVEAELAKYSESKSS